MPTEARGLGASGPHSLLCLCWACRQPDPTPVTLQFEGQEISLDPRMGIFITMNPGYAGRTELPESVKALFRPVVVIVPDLGQICEIMLFSEGFLQAKVSVPCPAIPLPCAAPSHWALGVTFRVALSLSSLSL